jgi:uncharacterized protein involved in type VI secretion and phage assembly
LGLLDALSGLQAPGGGASRIHGVVVAVVTDNADPESLGRVKLSFPWKADGDASTWARVATLMAGNDRGTWFLPEVGDEVLVAFDHGDVQHPYVLGALWNGQDKPAGDNSDGKNNIRRVKSRSGHELVLDDTVAAEKVTLKTKAGHTIILDDTPGGERIEIKDKSGSNTLVIDSVQNSISLESAMQIKMKAAVVEIEADATLTIKAGAVLTVQGAMVKIN